MTLPTHTSALAGFHVNCASILFELEFGDVGFCGEKKTRDPAGKPSNTRTNNKLNPHMVLGRN